MDFWRILSLLTAAGVAWLVYQRRLEARSASCAAAPAKAGTTVEEQVAAILAAD